MEGTAGTIKGWEVPLPFCLVVALLAASVVAGTAGAAVGAPLHPPPPPGQVSFGMEHISQGRFRPKRCASGAPNYGAHFRKGFTWGASAVGQLRFMANELRRRSGEPLSFVNLPQRAIFVPSDAARSAAFTCKSKPLLLSYIEYLNTTKCRFGDSLFSNIFHFHDF